MAGPDVFASLEGSGLNPFLFAGVGTEANGSELTVLSLLARLGSDPWAEAGALAALPKAASTAWLAERIEHIALAAHEAVDPRATASRLILLLPQQAGQSNVLAREKAVARPVPQTAFLTAVWIALALGLVASSMFAAPPADQQTVAHEPAGK